MGRLDARTKTIGELRYTADLEIDGMLHAAVVRSSVPRGAVRAIDASAALEMEGVIGVFSSEDVSPNPFGRIVCDVPILAGESVRYAGEPVAAVVATTRQIAETAASLVIVDYDEHEAARDLDEAQAEGAPHVHEAPWTYVGSVVHEDDEPNLQSIVVEGSLEEAEAALANAAMVIEASYETPAGHQGYLEPQACIVSVTDDGVRVWATTKAPYGLRSQLARCLGLAPNAITVEPMPLGGDFGGKGAPGHIPLCAELSRLVGRPVKLVLRYSEDLTATDVRHPVRCDVRLGADHEGRFVGGMLEFVCDGGAYAGYKPIPNVTLHGALDCASAYRFPALYTECRVLYTNTSPKGHMRAPGAPQAVFALESAIDELASAAGLPAAEIRRRNVLEDGETNPYGEHWVENRGREVLEAALRESGDPEAPEGWLVGRGIGLYARSTPLARHTSLRLVPLEGGRLRAEVPIPETGTGNHTVVRERLSAELGLESDDIDVVQVSTSELSNDPGVGGSRVTVQMSTAVSAAAKLWLDRVEDFPVTVELDPEPEPLVGSYCVQVATVAVDPDTGQYRVLEIVTALDVANIINEVAHQMQIDGGTVMGFGFGCLEDLALQEGQIWAGNLGEFKLPSVADLPELRTVLVRDSRGVGAANVKAIGELSNVPTAAAIANAIKAATGWRVRRLPITAERVLEAEQHADFPVVLH